MKEKLTFFEKQKTYSGSFPLISFQLRLFRCLPDDLRSRVEANKQAEALMQADNMDNVTISLYGIGLPNVHP